MCLDVLVCYVSATFNPLFPSRDGWRKALQAKGGGRVRSLSGPSAFVALDLRSHRKVGCLGDVTLPV
jgi:hypothetical protein